MKKRNKRILGILALIVLVAIIGMNFPLSVFGNNFFDNSNLRVQFTDDKSVTFKVEGTYTGQFGSLALRPETEKQSDIETLSFFMVSSDYPCDTSNCANTGLIGMKYPLTDIQISGIKGRLNYRTGSETEFSGTITTHNLTGFCSIPNGWVSFTKTSQTPSDVPYDLKQPFGLASKCEITGGKLRAIDSSGNDVTSEVSFYGNIQGSGTFVALKQGVQCTQNQLVKCGEGNFECLNNQCVQKLVTPPIDTTQTLIEDLTTEDTNKTTETAVISGQPATVTTLENLTTVTTITSLKNGTTTIIFEDRTSDTTLILYGVGLVVFVLLLGGLYWKTRK